MSGRRRVTAAAAVVASASATRAASATVPPFVPAPAAPTGAPVAVGDWAEENQRDLMQAIDRASRLLERHLAGAGGAVGGVDGEGGAIGPGESARDDGIGRSNAGVGEYALARLTALFELSDFEAGVLLLCAGVELSSAFAELVAAARGSADGRAAPTFGLALAVLPGAHWSALAPDAPLRRWRLVEVVAGPAATPLTEAPLRLDERVLHALAGVETLDERLAPYVTVVDEAGPRSTASGVSELAARLRQGPVQLVGGTSTPRANVAAAAASAAGMRLLRLELAAVPDAAAERLALARLLAREALLDGAAVAIDASGMSGASGDAHLRALVEGMAAMRPAVPRPAILVLADEPSPGLAGRVATVTLRPESSGERLATWRHVLGPHAASLNGSLTELASTFEISPESIALSTSGHAGDGAELHDELWEIARAAARPRMEGLAQRIEPVATWDDLVLPPDQLRTLHLIAVHLRLRHRVLDEWGFAAKSSRGLGTAALFSGPSGTGKTMAAEVLARELRLDLYRIDLASVVSKYIGETEKNLRRLFDAAEGSGAILLFDEADALFGKRSEVRDSHDRYANVEVGYLLQRMEAYRGLAILTTNAKEALDQAFLRRLRFQVTFPFPDAVLRAEIWRRVFPASTPTGGLDPDRLAQLNVPGGEIRNIALGAAYLAADAREPVSMRHVAAAARDEYAKRERQPSDAELRGWA